MCFETTSGSKLSPPVSRWTVPVQSLPGLRVQWGEHRLLPGLWGLQGNQTLKTGHQSQEDIRRVHLLRCTARGKCQITSILTLQDWLCRSYLAPIITIVSLCRWILTTRPKPSPRRTWSTPDKPALSWPSLKSTTWWRKTVTLASSNPPRTWRSAEKPRQPNGQRQRHVYSSKWT